MSIRSINQNSLNNNRIVSPTAVSYGDYLNLMPWSRPKEWLSMPSMTTSDEKIALLVKIVGPKTGISISLTGAGTGDFVINWGDGTSTLTGNGIHTHEYLYSDSDLNGTDGAVTFNSTTNQVERTSHGHVDGDRISFATDANGAIDTSVLYYVVNASLNSFQLSLTENGVPIEFNATGPGTILPYKQALVVITTDGRSIQEFSLVGSDPLVINPYLELKFSTPNLTTIPKLANVDIVNFTNPFVPNTSLNRVEIINYGSCTSMFGLFAHCTQLKEVIISADTSLVTNTSGMFRSAEAIRIAPMFDMSSVTDASFMFKNCEFFEEVPFYDTSSVTNMESMFGGTRISVLPNFNTANVTNMAAAFIGTNIKNIPPLNLTNVINASFAFAGTEIEQVPPLNTPNLTNASNMFNSCEYLKYVSLFDTSSVTNAQRMFYSCPSLITIPEFDLSGATTTNQMFSYCESLTYLPELNLFSCTNAEEMFSNCINLKHFSLVNTSNITSLYQTFYNCAGLEHMPLFDTSGVTNMDYAFANCYSLETVPLFNTSSVTTMYGIFNQCYKLRYVPLFNTTNVSEMGDMFSACKSLVTVPLFDTSSVTSMSGMFLDCRLLERIPLFDTSNVTLMANMFYNCCSLAFIPALNMTSASDYLPNFCTNSGVTRIEAYGYTGNNLYIEVNNSKMSGAALDEFYTNLGTATGDSVIIVEGNYGAPADTPSIATAKGWTVIG